MRSIETRIAALEKVAAQRAQEQVVRNEFCGAVPLVWRDGHVNGCAFIPCDHIPTLVEFAGLGRSHEACPDKADCRFAVAGVCRPREA